jgi:hypothetical protein
MANFVTKGCASIARIFHSYPTRDIPIELINKLGEWYYRIGKKLVVSFVRLLMGASYGHESHN